MPESATESASAALNAELCEVCGHPAHIDGDCIYRSPSLGRCHCIRTTERELDKDGLIAVLHEIYSDVLEDRLFSGPNLVFDLDSRSIFGEGDGTKTHDADTLLTTEFLWVVALLAEHVGEDAEVGIFVSGVKVVRA